LSGALNTRSESNLTPEISRRREAPIGWIEKLELTMPVRKQQCESCPFRGRVSEAEMREAAAISPEHWPCHTDDLYGDHGIQCRGHWGMRRRFANRYGQLELDRVTKAGMPDVSANNQI
jgi:hypothetical protein